MLGQADTLELLGLIKGFHGPQDTGDGSVAAWQMALRYGDITNLADAKAAVVAHYSTPGSNPWITPGDVIGHYKAIREDRLKRADFTHADLTEDVDPKDGTAYAATLRHRLRHLADGMPLAQVRALPLPPEARHAALTAENRPALMRPTP